MQVIVYLKHMEVRECTSVITNLLIDKNMNKQDLREASGISSASVAKLGKGDNITTEVLLRICTALKCDISDIMEVVEDTPQEDK